MKSFSNRDEIQLDIKAHIGRAAFRAGWRAIICFGLFVSVACAQRSNPRLVSNVNADGAVSDASAAPLKHYDIRPESLPAPDMRESVNNPPRIVARPAGAKLYAPPDFYVDTFAEGDFREPRAMALAPNGDVFLVDSSAGIVYVLRDTNGDGKADQRFVFARNLELPYGIAFHENYLYIANTNSVVRFPYKKGQTQAAGAPEKIIDLPGRGYNQHWTRTIVFSPDGKKLYVSVGSETNDSVEAEPMRAAITEFNPDGTGKRIFATGLRNAVGMAFNPTTKTLWATINERDGLGNNLPPDYFTSVQDGGFYGWPYCYIGKNIDPRHRGERPDLVPRAIVPDVLFTAHSAALDVVFYQGAMFPREYQGDAFVAMHGSWNRMPRTGYKVVRVHFQNGKPVGGYDDFVVGWLPDEQSREVWGRPVGLLVLKDGSLLISDDGGKKIWRVSYIGAKNK
jgi:glucose/arabinose dehydrogenase